MTEDQLKRAAAMLPEIQREQKKHRQVLMETRRELDAQRSRARTAALATALLEGRGPRSTTPEEREAFRVALERLLGEDVEREASSVPSAIESAGEPA